MAFHQKHIPAVLAVITAVLEIRRGYFRGFPDFLRRVRWRNFLAGILLAMVAGAVVLAADVQVLRWAQAQDAAWAKLLAGFGREMGRNGNTWTVLCGLYLMVTVFRRHEIRTRIFTIFLSSALTAGISSLFKITLLRARPYKDLGPLSFFNFSGFQQDHRAFQSCPSGDVAVVAGIAGYLFFTIRNPFLRAACFLLPLATALSRVSLNKHWPSDTVFATGLGLVSAWFILEFQKRVASKPQDLPPA